MRLRCLFIFNCCSFYAMRDGQQLAIAANAAKSVVMPDLRASGVEARRVKSEQGRFSLILRHRNRKMKSEPGWHGVQGKAGKNRHTSREL